MENLIYKEESFQIIGKCMEVHKILGHGFSEIVYKDALEYEFRKKPILFTREQEFEIAYKDTILKHTFFADFVVYDKIILELKCCTSLNDEMISQTINYLKASGCKLGLLVNFARKSLEYKRLVY